MNNSVFIDPEKLGRRGRKSRVEFAVIKSRCDTKRKTRNSKMPGFEIQATTYECNGDESNPKNWTQKGPKKWFGRDENGKASGQSRQPFTSRGQANHAVNILRSQLKAGQPLPA